MMVVLAMVMDFVYKKFNDVVVNAICYRETYGGDDVGHDEACWGSLKAERAQSPSQ